MVMNNKCYHFKLKEKNTYYQYQKRDTIGWLTSKGLPYNPSHTIAEFNQAAEFCETPQTVEQIV